MQDHKQSYKALLMSYHLKDVNRMHHISAPLIPFKHVSKGLMSGKQYSFKQQRPLSLSHIIRIAKHVAAKHGVEARKHVSNPLSRRGQRKTTIHLTQNPGMIYDDRHDTRLHDAHDDFHRIASEQLHSKNRTPTGKRSTKPIY